MKHETYKNYLEILIVTGNSGAGKSTVLSACEDYGFFCIDNLPYELLAPFFYGINHARMQHKKIALGIDVRSGLNLDLFAQELLQWQHICGDRMRILFLTAQEDTLMRRFQETRRKHPLSTNKTLREAIHEEYRILEPLRNIATETIETDTLTIAQLRLLVKNSNRDSEQKIIVTLTSFGFKYGTPRDCNFLYDLRSLPNPYFVPHLKELDGRSEKIQEYLFAQPAVQEYWKKLEDFFIFSLERSYHEGRFFLHIGFGCTGGKHRSVAFVERYSRLNLDHVQFFIHHKDIAITHAHERERDL
ncbi:MAG: RNase adapter RapZ [Candidatus Babeliaceae bacterium]|nr:RNase adapter RapZ [Candidatus Babeliaceae bacterium]